MANQQDDNPQGGVEQLPPGELPTHVFLQAGVGGLAAAVTAHLWETLGPRRPVVTVVEPAEADCLFESALAGSESPSRGSLKTSPFLFSKSYLSRILNSHICPPEK